MPKNSSATPLIKRFIDVDAQQAAIALEGLQEQDASAIIRHLPHGAAAACLQHVQPVFAASVLEQLLPEPASSILETLSPDHVADIFRSFSIEAKTALLESLAPERKKEIQELLSYPEDSAGRLMRTDLLAFYKDLTVREVIHRMRSVASKRASTYTYVVGPENKLVGVLNMRDLLLADSEAPIETVMRRDVVAVPPFTDREELVHLAHDKHFISIPVVDGQGKLIGAVKSEDMLEFSEKEATEDLHLLFGASPEERPFSPLLFKVTKRLPWLHVNLVTAFLAASVVALFQDLIGRIAVLAVFLPIVAGQGGNAGIQSLTVILRGLVLRDIRPKDARRLILMEIGTGLVNGVLIGLVTGCGAWLWRGNPFLGVVIGLAMVVNLVAAGLAGAAIPLAMKRLGFDPAQSSGIFLTTVTDVVGFFSFLAFAALFESKLL
ncbi:MAG: magnesium transporter [Elusimicrobia bacterium]|nr:magnesium transporter [Elusimicrobiota bacterium]